MKSSFTHEELRDLSENFGKDYLTDPTNTYIMTYIEYLKWRIELLKLDNVILFPIEKTIKENDKKDKK